MGRWRDTGVIPYLVWTTNPEIRAFVARIQTRLGTEQCLRPKDRTKALPVWTKPRLKGLGINVGAFGSWLRPVPCRQRRSRHDGAPHRSARWREGQEPRRAARRRYRGRGGDTQGPSACQPSPMSPEGLCAKTTQGPGQSAQAHALVDAWITQGHDPDAKRRGGLTVRSAGRRGGGSPRRPPSAPTSPILDMPRRQLQPVTADIFRGVWSMCGQNAPIERALAKCQSAVSLNKLQVKTLRFLQKTHWNQIGTFSGKNSRADTKCKPS